MADISVLLPDGTIRIYENIETITVDSASQAGATETFVSERLIQNQVQADWTETNTTSPAYILNKPENDLPAVDTTLDGKILGVIDGKWEITSLPEVEDELPQPTAVDNGRFLGIVDNKWQIADLPLPQPSANDNGKVLEVKDGVWTAVSMEESVISGFIENTLNSYIEEALGGEY